MSRKEWAAVLVVIGAGIVLQIPGQDNATMDHPGMDGSGMGQPGAMEAAPAPAAAPEGATEDARLVTVLLDVTGMT